MALRVLIVTQLACVGILGAVMRGTRLAPSVRGFAEPAAALAFFPVMVGFPLAVFVILRRAGLPWWKRLAILGIEIALGFATLVAILPAVQ